jgi:hypothetical protein
MAHTRNRGHMTLQPFRPHVPQWMRAHSPTPSATDLVRAARAPRPPGPPRRAHSASSQSHSLASFRA